MQENQIHLKIIRIFTDEANQADREVVRKWLNESENNKKLYRDLQEIWLTTGEKNNSDQYALDIAIKQFKAKTSRSVKYFDFRNILKYAAILILVIALPMMYFFGQKSSEADTFTTISCAYGDKSEVELPDGSKAWLNSGSTLKFNNNFKGDIRSVELEGEAYFSVTKDKKRSFTVETFGITTEVLGTEFNLTAYKEDQTVAATLVEGSIKVKSPIQHTILSPNQKLVYNKTSKKMERYQLQDISCDTEWRNGRMIFKGESLSSLEPKLERWFDVDIEFADEEVKKRRFSGILERESILEAVKYFDYSKYVGYKIEGNTITFYSE